MNHLNINQYIINMKHKWIHLTLSKCLANIKNYNYWQNLEKYPDFSKIIYAMIYIRTQSLQFSDQAWNEDLAWSLQRKRDFQIMMWFGQLK